LIVFDSDLCAMKAKTPYTRKSFLLSEYWTIRYNVVFDKGSGGYITH